MSRRSSALLLAVACAAIVAVVVPRLRIRRPVFVPVYRFADAQWRSRMETNAAASTVGSERAASDPRTVEYPTVSLQDEVRYSFGSHRRAPFLFYPTVKIPAEARLYVQSAAPPGFAVGDRVAVEPEINLQNVRSRLTPVLIDVREVDGVPAFSIDLDLPPETAAQTISLNLAGTALPHDKVLYHKTPPVQVPVGAYLDFAVGIEPVGWPQGRVEFRVKACEGAKCELLFREVLDPANENGRGWQPRRVQLQSVEGRSSSFVFESEVLSTSPSAFSLPVWGDPTVYGKAESGREPVNVILISLDTLSARHLSTYGYEHPTMPFLDKVVAGGGMVFDRAVAAATSTPQSHMSMFTSVQPCVHGIVTGLEVLGSELVTLAEVMRAAGYETGAVTEDGWLGYQHGFGRGFNSYAENKSADIMAPTGQLDATLAKAESWLTRNDDKPFFLFLHSFQVHDPYSPPPKYQDLFRLRDGTEVGPQSPRPLTDLVAYDQEIRYADDLIAGFFAFLTERKLPQNTVVVFTSDHGEEFFEHGRWGHGTNSYEQVTRVPLILWGPGRIPAGVRRAETVGHIDLMPTILALASVAPPEQTTGRNLLADPSPSADREPVTRFSESRSEVAIGVGYESILITPPSFMAQQGSRKLSRYRTDEGGFRYEAYDLATDPEERANLFESSGAAFEPLKRLIDGYESACKAEPGQKIQMDPEQEKKLRALGYVD